jgi:3-oxoadipate enol-lactonase/4-carboxymuconolactone decarboxylase
VTTVVLSGSLGSSSAMWDAQVLALSGHDVVRIDHPGHGGSPLADVSDVADLARRVPGERFSFVGLSLGGAVGMWLALHEPDRLDKLVLASTAARFGDPQQWRERAATVRGHGLEAIVDSVLARWFTPSFRESARFRDMFLSTDPEGYARCCEAIAHWDVTGQLARISVPTLVIAGTEDPSTPPDQLRAIAAEIPGSQLELVDGARHLVNVEFDAQFNALLRDFL